MFNVDDATLEVLYSAFQRMDNETVAAVPVADPVEVVPAVPSVNWLLALVGTFFAALGIA